MTLRTRTAAAGFTLTHLATCLLGLLTVSGLARAEERLWSVRAGSSVALMLGEDQLDRMHLDAPGVLGELAASYEAVPWLDGQLTARGGGFLSSGANGGLLVPSVGLRFHTRRSSLTPYALFDAGPAFTGSIVRPYVGAGVGLDVKVGKAWTLGPALGIGDVVQWNGSGNSSDALYIHVGLALSFRPAPRRLPPPPPRPPARKRPLPAEPVTAPASLDMELLMESTFGGSTRIELLAPVLFALDSDQLQPLGVAMLHEVAATLRERDDILLLEIQGYADQRGNDEHNELLSRRRAERVRDWLINHGIADQRLRVTARGARAPLETSGDEAAHQQNRRVVFRVIEAAP